MDKLYHKIKVVTKLNEIVLGSRLKAWMEYKEARERGYPEEIEETYQDYLDHEGVRVKILTPVEALEDQVHDTWMGIRNPNKAHLTSEAIREFRKILEHIAAGLLHSAGSLAWIRALREHQGEEDVLIDEDIVYLAFLDILTSGDEETIEDYNALYTSLIYGEGDVEYDTIKQE